MIGFKICIWVLSARTFISSDVGQNLPFNFCNLLILVFFFFFGGHFRFRAFSLGSQRSWWRRRQRYMKCRRWKGNLPPHDWR